MKQFILTISFTLLSISFFGQLIVNTPITATNAVQNILLGPGVTATNITFTGNGVQLGSFNGTASNIGLGSGIIIGSGDVALAVGPNGSGFVGSPEVYNNNDADLASISGQAMRDAAILEFDFIPTGDSIEFRYVFASEEYNEFVCSNFNDAFGFFLSGPGITGTFTSPPGFPGGSQNLALIPGSTTFVTINTVNNGIDPGNFSCPPGGLGNSAFFVDNDNPPGTTVQYDGFTVVLTAKSAVQCGQLHHIKLAVADALDQSYDSGVFIEAGSFKSNQVVLNSNVDVSNGDSVLYEGCGIANLMFSKSDTVGTQVVKFTISGSATNGVDYPFLPDSIVFQPGQDTVVISISGIVDGSTEGLEKVIITYIQTICNQPDTQTITFYIADYDSLQIIPNDSSIFCAGDSVPIWFDISGPPHTIQWQFGGQTADTIYVNPNSPTYYVATITDTCGVYVRTDSVLVTLPAYTFNLIIPNDTTKVCPAQNYTFFADVGNSSAPPFTYLWSNASINDSITVNPLVSTTYIVTVTDGCNNSLTDSVRVNVTPYQPVNIIMSNDTTICPNAPINIGAQVSGGVGQYSISWNNGLPVQLNQNVSPSTTTNYVITISDSCGFTYKDSVLITVLQAAPMVLQLNDTSKICPSDTITLTPFFSGGYSPFNYSWSNGDTTLSTIVSPLITTNYQLTVTDFCANQASLNVVVTVSNYQPLNVYVPQDTTILCAGEGILLTGGYSGGTAKVGYYWTDGITYYYNTNNITVNPITSTTYYLVVEDTCTSEIDTNSFTVTVPVYSPLSLLVSNDTTICSEDPLILGANATGGAGGYVYTWQIYGVTDTIYVAPQNTTTYNVTVKDACGLMVNEEINVSISVILADFSYENLVGFSLQFYDKSISNGVSWWWNFNNEDSSLLKNPQYEFTVYEDKYVSLTVENAIGCRDSVTKLIVPPMGIYLPNTFTPTGDGINDLFYVTGYGIKELSYLIFDRWGELIFEAENISVGWDGTYKGAKCQTGVYVCKVLAKGYNDEYHEKLYKVTILK